MRYRYLKFALGLLLALWLTPAVYAGATATVELEPTPGCTAGAMLAIIIDDMGNNFERGKAALALPGNLTYAVLPHSRFGPRLAARASEADREVMLHLPMSSLGDLPLGPGGLTAELSKLEFRAALRKALAQIPAARGINNHMGSDLTQRRTQMAWMMQELRAREMYFVDSRTSDATIAATVAEEFNVPHLSRKVFLDNRRESPAIDKKFREAMRVAKREGLAVVIGHPYPQTLDYLQEALPLALQQGIRLVSISEALVAPHTTGSRATDHSRTSIPCSAI